MKKSTSHFLAMWCREGLECVFDLKELQTETVNWQKNKVWNILREQDSGIPEPSIPLQMMILRAKSNPQRCYEIYTFNADSGISKSLIEELFQTNPQYIVDFIRKNGFKVYSDHGLEKTAVIS